MRSPPDGYHGYWAKSLFEINPEYGTRDELKALVREAHEKGELADAVVNCWTDLSSVGSQPLGSLYNWFWANHVVGIGIEFARMASREGRLCCRVALGQAMLPRSKVSLAGQFSQKDFVPESVA